MGTGIQLALNGNTTTQSLSNLSECRVRRFVPKSPETQARYTDPVGWNGEEMIDAAFGVVTESADVTFIGNAAYIRSYIRNIERVFNEARQWASGVRWGGLAVQPNVSYDPDGNLAQPYISPLLDGRVDLADDALNTQWISGIVDATITWTRRPFWQDQSPTVLTLSSSVRANSTALVVDNCDDSLRKNWASIDGTAILGDVPTPAYIGILNSDGTYTLRNLWLGVATWTGFSNSYPLWWEAEDNPVTGSPYPTHAITGSATASRDNYDTVTWNTANKMDVYTLPLSANLLNVVNAGYLRLIGRLYGMPANSDVLASARIEADLVPLWQGPQVLLPSALSSSEVVDFGLVRIPPALTGLYNYRALNLVIEHQRPGWASGTQNVSWDYFHLMPTDGWRKYTSVGLDLNLSTKIIDDGPRGLVYADINPGGTAQYVARHAVTGSPIMLQPGRNTRLYVLRDRYTGTLPRSAIVTLNVSYYTRRLLV